MILKSIKKVLQSWVYTYGEWGWIFWLVLVVGYYILFADKSGWVWVVNVGIWCSISGYEIGSRVARYLSRLEGLSETYGLTQLIKYRDHTGRRHMITKEAPVDFEDWSVEDKAAWVERAKDELWAQADTHVARLKEEAEGGPTQSKKM